MTGIYALTILLALSASTLIGLAIFTAYTKPASGQPFALFLLGSAGWTLAQIGELLSFTEASKVMVIDVMYLAVMVTVIAWFIFTVVHSGNRRWISAGRLIAIVAPAIFILLAVWSNRQHHLYFATLTVAADGPFPTATEVVYGPLFTVNVIYIYLLVLAGVVLLIRSLIQSPQLYRGQTGLLLAGISMPLIAGTIQLSGLTGRYFDPVPIGFAIMGVLISRVVLRGRLFSVIPIARDQVIENLIDGVIILDQDDRIIDMNPMAEHIMQQSAKEIIGLPASESLYKRLNLIDDNEDVILISDEIGLVIESKSHIFKLRINPIYSRNKKLSGKVVTLHDITLLKEAHNQLAALRQIESELNRKLSVRYVLRIAEDAAIRMSYADAVLIAFIESDGLRVVKTYGQYSNDLLGTLLSIDEGIIGRVSKRRKGEYIKDVTRDPDYITHHSETKSQITIPLISQNRLIGVLSLKTNRTKRFTLAVYETLLLLAARVAVAIDNAQAYEERATLIDELNAYAHMVAHDLKNPIAATIGYVNLLETVAFDQFSPKIQGYVRQISRNNYKMTSIIDELLLLASIRTKEDIKMVPIYMAGIVKEIQERLEGTLRDSGSQLKIADDWPVVIGYAAWVEEVWVNFMTNAIKYGGTPPQIELGHDQVGGSIRFWVKDNGRGLTQEQQSRLFAQFSRLGGEQSEGHGLGLSIAQRIIKKMGGTIGVESRVGEGSKFYFTLPPKKE